MNFHIINIDNTTFGTGGALISSLEIIEFRNIVNKIIHPDKSFNPWRFGGIINHEIGHDFGLCHAQSSSNLCMDIPNNEVCDDGVVDSNCNMASIPCDSGGLNNTMISGAAAQRGVTPCQFAKAFAGMVNNKSWRTAYFNQCEDLIIDKPQETTYIDCPLFICSKLIIKTGSEAVLRGRLIMNENSEIIVERGARFVMDNGEITGKEMNPGYWKGINLSDGYGDQVPITTSIADYPPLASSSFVAIGNGNTNYIEYAKIAIESRESPLGVLGGRTSLIHLDGIWIRNNEVGLSINNYLNVRSVNAYLQTVTFRDNSLGDLKIIGGRDISIHECYFVGDAEYGITLVDTELSGYNDCGINDKEIGMDIKCTYPYHPGFKIGDETGTSNFFRYNRDAVHIGAGIGVGNTQDLEIFRTRFEVGFLGVQVLGVAGYEIYNSTFPSVKHGVLSAFSSFAESTIHCNQFSDDQGAFAIATFGDNRNLTMHSNEFDMANETSTGIWRVNGDIFQVQSANYDFGNFDIADNPPAGNQFFDVGSDLKFFYDGNTVDYLVPQPGGEPQYYPQTVGDYNTIFSFENVTDCPDDDNFNGGGTVLTLPELFIPDDSTNVWDEPIGDPAVLDEYLAYIFNLPGAADDGRTRTEIARVRFALYRWVVYMLEHPNNYDLSAIEDFVDTDYQRLLIGYYIHTEDAFNANRILDNLPRINEVNRDFATIQEVNLKRLFPAFYTINNYTPTSTKLQEIRNIAEKFSENTGYASALYYLCTNEKVYPDFDFTNTQPRSSGIDSESDELWLDIYPNPTNGAINLNSNEEISEYTLYDSYGRLQVRKFVKNVKKPTLDISGYSKGIYILNVKYGTKIITKKIVKI